MPHTPPVTCADCGTRFVRDTDSDYRHFVIQCDACLPGDALACITSEHDARAFVQERMARLSIFPFPKRWDLYQHANGSRYRVELVANVDSERPEYPTTVCYRGEDGRVWSKTLGEFHAKMTLLEETP